jgi:hypothetical protein
VDALGRWGVRWIPELGDEDLDPHLLLWDMHRNVDLCDFDPGYPEYASVEGDLRTLSMVWRGDLSWPEALRSGRLEVDGQPRAASNVPWLGQGSFATVPRLAGQAAPVRAAVTATVV